MSSGFNDKYSTVTYNSRSETSREVNQFESPGRFGRSADQITSYSFDTTLSFVARENPSVRSRVRVEWRQCRLREKFSGASYRMYDFANINAYEALVRLSIDIQTVRQTWNTRYYTYVCTWMHVCTIRLIFRNDFTQSWNNFRSPSTWLF